MKIRKVKPYGYHDSHNNTPEKRARNHLFFSTNIGKYFQRKEILFFKSKKIYFCRLIRGVAQLASVLAWGASGRKFESSHPDFYFKTISVYHS